MCSGFENIFMWCSFDLGFLGANYEVNILLYVCFLYIYVWDVEFEKKIHCE